MPHHGSKKGRADPEGSALFLPFPEDFSELEEAEQTLLSLVRDTERDDAQ